MKEAETKKAHSLLDIGAGNGLLSIPLSKGFRSYVAVEPKSKYVEILKNAGLEVIQAEFPVPVREKFDMVLCSHSISYLDKKYEVFLRAAWEAVGLGGELLLITFRGAEDDWNNLMKNLEPSKSELNLSEFNHILELLRSFGEMNMRIVTTRVTTGTLPELINALSFVYSDGVKERKEHFLSFGPKLEETLRSYKNANGFFFPFQHFFISATKS